MNFMRSGATVCALVGLAMAGAAAAAPTIQVTCETRPDRSKISVDGKGLARRANYTTEVVSGGATAKSAVQVANQRGEIETDYDSNPADIAAGAVAIASTFIANNTVTGKIVAASGAVVISDTVSCRARSR